MKPQAAFTIVELMVTVAVVAILLVVAIPSMDYMLVSSRITSKTSDFIRTLNYARTEAVTRNTTIQITPRNQEEQVESKKWSKGWQICCDKDNQPQIKEYEDEISLGVSSGQANMIRYDAKGKVPEAQSQTLQFTVCSKKHPEIDGRVITIRPIGTINVRRTRVSCR